MAVTDSGTISTLKDEEETPQKSGVESRRHARFDVEGEAEIVVRNGASLFRGRILDISESGCYIQTLAYIKLVPSTMVDIRFVVKGKILSISAETRSYTPKVGIGFQFVAMDLKSTDTLKTILASLQQNA